MAGFTMQVQSAISLLYVRWHPDRPRVVWDVIPIHSGLARVPLIYQSGSLIPHLPFGGGMRATQNSKLGTEKSQSDLDRVRKILSLV